MRRLVLPGTRQLPRRWTDIDPAMGPKITANRFDHALAGLDKLIARRDREIKRRREAIDDEIRQRDAEASKRAKERR